MEEEIELCLANSEEQLKTKNCNNREFVAGECSGLQMILDFAEIYQDQRMLRDK